MSKKLMERNSDGREDQSADDYFVIRVEYGGYAVTEDTAAEVMRQVARRWPPRWIGFIDIHGARVRIRTRLITMVQECTAAHRQRERDFDRALQLEEKKDRRPWEDDD